MIHRIFDMLKFDQNFLLLLGKNDSGWCHFSTVISWGRTDMYTKGDEEYITRSRSDVLLTEIGVRS